jgi:hypothetical protein
MLTRLRVIGTVVAALVALVPASMEPATAAGTTVKLSQPIFTSYHSDYSDPTYNYWDTAFTFHWAVSASSGVCSQTLTYANYDTLGGDFDPILQQESSTISLSKSARSYAAATDAPDYSRGGYSVVIRIKGCDGRIAASNPVRTVVVPREETDPGITYSGTWSVSHCACASGGTTRWTTAKNASVTFRTQAPQDGSGVDVALIMAKASNRGSAAVYVDGVKKATVNTYAPSPVNGKITYQILLPGLASHTVKIVNLATAGHPRIDLDATINGG